MTINPRQTRLLLFNPFNGRPLPRPAVLLAEDYRHPSDPPTWAFNPWTGDARFAEAIKADPWGERLDDGLESSATPYWVAEVLAELVRARIKFPEPDLLGMALAEEAGEVMKEMLDLRSGKPGASVAEIHKECIQTMAMCVRLMEEGDPAVLPGITGF